MAKKDLLEGKVKKGGLNQPPKTGKPDISPIALRPSWSGRKFRRKPEIVEAKQSSSGLWEILKSDLGVKDLHLYDDEEFRAMFEPAAEGE